MKSADVIETIKQVKSLRIGDFDVQLENTGPGAGKITVTDSWCNNYYYHWRAMGKDRTLEEFIVDINSDYFTNNLLGHRESAPIDQKKTMREVRKAIGEFLPWYEEMEFQKDMRYELRNAPNWENDQHFMHGICRLINNLPYYNIEGRFQEKFIRDGFRQLFSEPWHYIVHGPDPKRVMLERLHKQLVTYLKKKQK